mmetsp:Transcript_2160/g.5098  ORF Transcript_2160/g.5098 Transcript_2160/m.5098 type:complete len:129 (-) Transcript_2160:24-410(-)
MWLQRGKKAKITMEKWAKSSEWNFQSRFFLLEAEAYFCIKDYNSARASYDKAIASAKKHRFVNEEALANETAGYFFMDLGRKDDCLRYMLEAHKLYHAWGAQAKSNALYDFTMKSFEGANSRHSFNTT